MAPRKTKNYLCPMISPNSFKKLPLTAIVLTFNEEQNIGDCLDSIHGFVDEIYVLDSFSRDATLAIAANYNGVKVVQNTFENYSVQRNWAFDNLEIRNDFILNLDADHRVMPELINELQRQFSTGIPSHINGFMASRRTMFLGKWIKRGGHFPVYHGIIFRKGFGTCELKKYDQHFLIEGEATVLQHNVIDIITESLSVFTARHNTWSSLEAEDVMAYKLSAGKGRVQARKNGNEMEQRRYQRMKYYSYPAFWRVFLYFFYRYIVKGGFREGIPGLIFHFLQGFWFRFLVDAKIWELEKNNAK
ncbi:MAG: glycosyltransferase involved in cell wall biosynthesis [Arcticibacterium sp.]|jgi:glycosyltransferase involved in cell wall biosynthesis